MGLMGGVVHAEQSVPENKQYISFSAIPLASGDCLIVWSEGTYGEGTSEVQALYVRMVRADNVQLWETSFDVLSRLDSFANGGIMPDGRIWLHRRLAHGSSATTHYAFVTLSKDGEMERSIPLPEWAEHVHVANGSIYVAGERATTDAERRAGLGYASPCAAKLDAEGAVVFVWDATETFDLLSDAYTPDNVFRLHGGTAPAVDGIFLHGMQRETRDADSSRSILLRINDEGQIAFVHRTEVLQRIISICPLPDGGVVGVGCHNQDNSWSDKHFVFRLDSSGQVLFTSLLSIAPVSKCDDIRPVDGGYAIIGQVEAKSIKPVEQRLGPTISFVATIDDTGELVEWRMFEPSITRVRFLPPYSEADTLLVSYVNGSGPMESWRIMPLESAIWDVQPADLLK